MYFPDLTPLFYLAAFGLFCAAIIAVIGVPLGLWWLFHHVAFY